jgi:hypothetical protein
MTVRRHLVADPNLEALLGVALAAAGFFVIHSAYAGRDRKTPWALGPFLPW